MFAKIIYGSSRTKVNGKFLIVTFTLFLLTLLVQAKSWGAHSAARLSLMLLRNECHLLTEW